MASLQKGSLFSALSALSNEIQTEKTAAAHGRAKQADNPVPSDPGGYQGASTHPTANVDNRGQSVSEGSRSSENESDVKADIPDNVNSASDAKDGQSNDVNLNIGTQQSATGEDASVEDDYKGGKDDPGSSHPARTDNESLDGHKYAGLTMTKAYDLHTELANGILADLANGQGNQLTKQALADAKAGLNVAAAGAKPPAQPKPQMAGQAPAGQKIASASPLASAIEKAAAAVKAGKAGDSPAAGNADLQAGYELAAILGVEKRAAQAVVAELVENTINDAHKDADLFGSYYTTFMKRAGDEGGEGEDHSKGGDDTSGASGAEGTGGETSAGDGGHDDAGGAGGGGGGESLGDMLGGGSDPGGLMAGGGAGGGMGGGMGGAPDESAAIMQLAAALDELGIPLDQLAAAGAGGGGGMGAPPMGGAPDPLAGGAPPMGGGAPPMGGGAPPMGGGAPPPPGGDPMAGGGAPPMGEGMKLASVVANFKRSGKYQFKAANAGTPERIMRDQMKNYLRELIA